MARRGNFSPWPAEKPCRNSRNPAPVLARNNKGDVGMKLEWAEAIKANNPKLALSNFNHAGNFTEAILMGNIACASAKASTGTPKNSSPQTKKPPRLSPKSTALVGRFNLNAKLVATLTLVLGIMASVALGADKKAPPLPAPTKVQSKANKLPLFSRPMVP